VANENSRAVYPGFGTLGMMGTFSNSEYNALQTRVTKRYARGFTLLGTFTYSKSRDESSSSTTDTAAIPNPYNLRNEWALSDFYSKYIASAAAIWNAPRLDGRNILLREAAGGWNVSMRWTAHTGNPINVVTGADNALSGTPQQRPNVTGDPNFSGDRPLQDRLNAWFNTAAFSAPSAGTYGNTGRNALIGPGSNSTNAAMMKNFAIPAREGTYVQFRAEAFSLFNTPIFSKPGNTLGSSLGKITSASGDRQIQFALKLVF